MTKQKFGIVLPVTLLAYFLILMDNSIIFTSSVEIGQSLHLSAISLSWVSSAYTLTFGGFLLLSGRLSDLLGRKRIFLIGLTIFGLSSLVIGVAQNSATMIGMRALQGIGSSIIAPTTLALIMDAYKDETRQKAISYYGATAGIGSSIGLLIGGGLTSLISWRAGFLINVPFTLVLIILTAKYIDDSVTKPEKIDYLGSLYSILGLGSIIYGFTEQNWWIILIGVLLMGVFIRRENHIDYPLLPLSLFKNRVRSGAYATRLLFMMTMLPFWYFLPQMFQSQYGFSAFEAGLAFLPMTLVNFVVALWLPNLTRRFGNGRILLAGELVLVVGLLILAFSNPAAGYWRTVLIPMLILGLGQGLTLAPVTSAGVHEAPDAMAGIASGVTNSMHQIGGPIGLSIIVSMTSGFQNEVWFMVGFTVVAAIIVAIFVDGRQS
ncbi:MFS transporter [Lacticaseibacillus brantae]|uniref:Transporter, major facilitator family n=1 Tax=Lacticaseibacillus brantae DSM 23927 TaxID=1423727 RepID=A0A0R2AYZ1_9LACO|nr:MFS transporter [Lacticaseibacillus brantae]KRM72042.1 transporter, major facilitator family [Lacticaseibacillus brantae DSM 23927]